ncbi:MAG: hypothetical protein QXS00_07950 [Pyrobaculum sp.]
MFREVIVFAAAAAVAVLILAYAGGLFPPVKPYGEPQPYLTFKNTSRGVEVGVFDYAGYAPRAAHIYVNGRYAGSAASFARQGDAVGAWTGVYVKCGDFVEVLVQYDGFQRKFEGRVRCSEPLKSFGGGGVVYFGSRTPMEAAATLSSLGIEITTSCKEVEIQRGWASYVDMLYPVFYIKARNAMFLEYQTEYDRYTEAGPGAVITIDPGGARTIRGFFRSYIYPPYGYTLSDYQGSRNANMSFIVEVIGTYIYNYGSFLVQYTSTKGYVEIDGVRYEIALCKYNITERIVWETETYSLYDANQLEPDAVYEVFIIGQDGKTVYRQTMAFYPGNKAMRVTTSKVDADPDAVRKNYVKATMTFPDGSKYEVYGNNLIDASNAFRDRFYPTTYNLNLDHYQVLNDIKNTFNRGEAYDKIFGNTWNIMYLGERTERRAYVDLQITKHIKPGGISAGFEWIAVPGVFKGLTAGGWDMFINMAPNKVVINSTSPPIVLTLGDFAAFRTR